MSTLITNAEGCEYICLCMSMCAWSVNSYRGNCFSKYSVMILGLRISASRNMWEIKIGYTFCVCERSASLQ